jgi:hypothetical protein
MNRDIDIENRSEREAQTARSRQDQPGARAAEPALSREHSVIRFRGHSYFWSEAERETMREIGRFRTVAVEDLERYRYAGKAGAARRDLRALQDQGLIQRRSVWSGPRSQKLVVVVLTKQGKALLKEHGGHPRGQTIHCGFVKPREVRHDAAIYRMFQAEREKIERSGGRVRRIVLDYELKKKVYSPLAKARQLAPLEYQRRQAEVARQNGLKVIDGKIPLPDLRIEYDTPEGEPARVDLELATGHYHGKSLREKAEAGFKMYAAEGSHSRLSRVLEERELTASILSL